MNDDYSLGDSRVLDVASRRAQAHKVLAVVEHFSRTHDCPLDAGARALDVGCSSGLIAHALAQRFACVIGVDVDRQALARHDSPCPAAHLALASGLALPFAQEQFDFVLCNQVYQYVPDVSLLLAEIQRVLRAGAFCYFSARNLRGVLSPENWLPLLASRAPRLARRLSHSWQARAGTLWSYRRLRTLAARYFVVHDYSTRVLSTPALRAQFAPARTGWLARAPAPALAALKPLLPAHIWILQKT